MITEKDLLLRAQVLSTIVDTIVEKILERPDGMWILILAEDDEQQEDTTRSLMATSKNVTLTGITQLLQTTLEKAIERKKEEARDVH